tara:strand:- start:25 stop:312 length:288 start_codon:yes stop_codon:yes gene_type:complete
MFRKLRKSKNTVSIIFEGEKINVEDGQTVAAALLSRGYFVLRDSKINSNPRSVFCMMGICFECLMIIDGFRGQQACLVQVKEGMEIKLQKDVSKN